jgi:hypothetical protein
MDGQRLTKMPKTWCCYRAAAQRSLDALPRATRPAAAASSTSNLLLHLASPSSNQQAKLLLLLLVVVVLPRG